MSTTVQHPNRRAKPMRASIAALIKWYPCTSVRMFERVHAMHPGYPLISGGRARLTSRCGTVIEPSVG